MAGPADRSLAYAVRGRAVLKYHGELCVSLVGVALVPAAFAFLAGDLGFALRASAAVAVLGAAGFFLSRVRGPRELQANEALVVVAFGYLLTAALMTWPLAADGLAPLDALFHAISAVTTTGLSTAGSLEARSPSFLFAQAWMQWYGGLVIVVLAVFLVGPGSAAKQLSMSEAEEADILSGTRARALHMLIVYGGLTALGVLWLLLLTADWREAVLHALTAVSTGGFSSHDDSLRSLGGWPAQAGVLVLAVAGAAPFARYRRLVRWRRAERQGPGGFVDGEVLALFALCALAAGLVGASMGLAGGMSWSEVLRAAPLLAVSAQTTAGFSPVAVGSLDDGSKLILVASMLIGGDLGSTAGGLKIFRVLLVIRLVHLVLLRPALPPHAVARPHLGHRPLDEKDIQDALGIMALFGGVVLVSWLAFVVHGHPPLDSLFEVASAIGTVGLSTGLAGPDLAPLLKGVLCLDMWMGRLEVLAVLILFHPRTWLGRRAEIR